ncbi:hypothetical protein HBI26_133870 [Parastagonospora nodorum]|nr:hypothetical protein HBI26_133870 [Parastagonospora nodorum]
MVRATCSPSMVEVARASAKISLMRLTNMELHHVDSSQTRASSPSCSRGSNIRHNGTPLHHRLRPQEARRSFRQRHQGRPMGTIRAMAIHWPLHPLPTLQGLIPRPRHRDCRFRRLPRS